jgi:hypothetical protein
VWVPELESELALESALELELESESASESALELALALESASVVVADQEEAGSRHPGC